MKVGIQLYSVRNSLKEAPLETLRAVADAGYKYVEFANGNTTEDPGSGFGMPAAEMKDFLDTNGIKVVGAHLAPLDPDNLDRIIEYHQAVGNTRVGWAMGFWNSMDEIKRGAELFNRLGEKFRAAGIQFYYHNHFQEFREFDGKPALYHLADLTEPENLSFELDTFWCCRGGYDPIAVMDRLGSRVILLHQKDFWKDSPDDVQYLGKVIPNDTEITFEHFHVAGRPENFVEIGTGILPIQSYIDKGNEVGVKFVVLEQDHTKLGEIKSIQVSMESFRKFEGIEFE